MWYSLTGRVSQVKKDFFVLEIGGLGYKVFSNAETLARVSGDVTIYTHAHIKEDAFDIFGFLSEESLQLFELLISVSGVGPKTALGILDLDTIPNTTAAILDKRADILSRASGIGKKTAERIILELHTKVAGFVPGGTSEKFDVTRETQEVLENLGYPSMIARKIAGEAEGKTTEERVRNALYIIGKK